MHMHVLPGLDRPHSLPNLTPVLDRGITHRKIAERELVTKRNILNRLCGQGFVGGKIPACAIRTGRDIDNRYAHSIH
jgi:hypothetical protein